MNKTIFVGLTLFLFSSVSISHPIIGLDNPPKAIVQPSNVNFYYDPSDYAFASYGTYFHNTLELSAYSSGGSEFNTKNLTALKMPEDQFGVWNLSIPAIALGKNKIIYWCFLKEPATFFNSYDHNLTVTNDPSVTCYDVLAISPTTMVVDCQNNQNALLYVIDIVNNVTNKTVVTSPLINGMSSALRRSITFSINDSVTYICRFQSKSPTYIDVFSISGSYSKRNVTYLSSITSNLLGRLFSPMSVSVFKGNLFVANYNTREILMLRKNDANFKNFTITSFPLDAGP